MKNIILTMPALILSMHSIAQNVWTGSSVQTNTNGNLTVGGSATVTGSANLNGGFTAAGSTVNGNLAVNDGYLHLRPTPILLPIPNYKLYIENTNVAATSNGFYNGITNTLTGTQYGFSQSTIFNGTSGIKYGINNLTTTNTSSTTYGFYNQVSTDGNGPRYGIYNRVYATGTGTQYGIYNYVQDNGAIRYGIYSDARGVNAKAGYFLGDLENNGNFMMTANNQNRMIFQNFTSGVAVPLGSQYVNVMFNTTSGQNDWNANNGLRLYNNGLIEKYTTITNDKVFTIKRADLNEEVFQVHGDGKTYVTELNVRLYTDFPDYVFKPDYRLMPLTEIEQYIEENGHLPQMPTAATVAEEGLNVGETTRVLVEKIEELTLYLIEQQKEIEMLKAKLKQNEQ